MLDLLLLIVKCPFNKIKILQWTVKALEKSFKLMYRNTHLNSHERVPFKALQIYCRGIHSASSHLLAQPGADAGGHSLQELHCQVHSVKWLVIPVHTFLI